jgi:hypothetical protein
LRQGAFYKVGNEMPGVSGTSGTGNELATLSMREVLEGFKKLGIELRGSRGLGDDFSKRVRRLLAKSIAREYWFPTREHMARAGLPVRKACKVAGVDPSTPTRWDEMVPDYTTICTLFARCDLDMNDVPFPKGHDAFLAAFFTTLKFIRDQELKEKPSASIDRERWECLRHVMLSQAIIDAMTVAIDPVMSGGYRESSKATTLKENLGSALEMIAAKVAKRFPAGSIKNAADVQTTVSDWLIPWVLFYTVVSSVPKDHAS